MKRREDYRETFKNEKERELWFQYILKLNDRDISRKQISKFTYLGIAATVALLSYNAIGFIALIASDNTYISLMVAVLYNLFTFMFAFVFFGIVICFWIVETKFKKISGLALQEVCIYIEALFNFLSYLFMVLLLYSIVFYYNNAINTYYLIPVGATVGMHLIFSYRKNRNAQPNKIKEALDRNNLKHYYSTFYFIIGIIFTVSAIFSTINLFSVFHKAYEVQFLKYCLNIFAILILSVCFIFMLIWEAMYNAKLLEFEQNIILNNLTAREIKKAYTIDYAGETAEGYIINEHERVVELIDNAKIKMSQRLSAIKNGTYREILKACYENNLMITECHEKSTSVIIQLKLLMANENSVPHKLGGNVIIDTLKYKNSEIVNESMIYCKMCHDIIIEKNIEGIISEKYPSCSNEALKCRELTSNNAV